MDPNNPISLNIIHLNNYYNKEESLILFTFLREFRAWILELANLDLWEYLILTINTHLCSPKNLNSLPLLFILLESRDDYFFYYYSISIT